ncbi:hypothetical protein SAMN05446934_9756 [Paraburkholderia hospita]|jgi:hypothetical protein|nr:hypothetical protein PMI06_009027 [Burkholderia sp. BT03]SKC56132.1 hypothetical protein SAMN06266956_0789 [Paraburkholderia hospita]SKD05844.1 hypothetical protein SAMN05446934_9756 [Paraburkholderia hospita]
MTLRPSATSNRSWTFTLQWWMTLAPASELIAEPLIRAKSGDLVILLCPDEEARQAALTVLGVARKSDVQ